MGVWNLTNCKLRTNLVGHTGYLNTVEANAIIYSMVFSPNRYWLCAATDACIKIWDLESKSVVDELSPDFPPVGKKAMTHHCISLCWSADGATLFSGYTVTPHRCCAATTSSTF